MAPTEDGTTYEAFLSYSRRDAAVATEVQRRLERLGRRRSELPTIRIFRDETDLRTTDDLHYALSGHIEASGAFVVLCSPAAAASQFVAAEIDMWRRAKPDEPIVLVVADGELEWDDEQGRFDLERSTALPPSLADHFASVPTWIDLWSSASDSHLRPGRRPRLPDDGVHQLASVVLDRDLREIRAEEQRIQRRQLRVTRSVAVVIAVLAIAAGLAFLDSRRSAERAAEQRDIAQSQALAGTAQALFDEDPDLAMLLAIEADRIVSTPESQSSLLDVAFRGGNLGLVSWGADDSGTWVSAAYNPEDQILFISLVETTDLLRADLSEERPMFEQVRSPGEAVAQNLGFDVERGVLYAIDEAGNVATRDGVTGEIQSTASLGAPIYGARVSADGRSFVAVTSATGQAWEAIVGSAEQPATASRVTLPFPPWGVAVAPDERLAVVSGTGVVAVSDPATGEWIQWTENRIPVIAAFSFDGTQLATGARDGGVRLYNVEEMTEAGVAEAPVLGQSSVVEFAETELPTVGHSGEVQAVVATDQPEGVAFWSVGSDGTALAWSDDNAVVFGPIRLVHGGSAVYARPLPNGSGLLTMGRDSSFQLYRGPQGSVVFRGGSFVDADDTGSPIEAQYVVISPKGGVSTDDSTVGVRSDGEAVRIEVGAAEESASIPLGFNVGLTAADLLTMAESPDGRLVAVGGRDGAAGIVAVWDVERGELVGEASRPAWVSGVSFASDDTIYVTDQSFRGLSVYAADTGGLTLTEVFESPIGQSPAPFADGAVGLGIGGPEDGRVAIVGYGRATEFMVVAGGEIEEHNLGVPLQQIEVVAVNPAGTLAALAVSDGRVFLWDLARGETAGRPIDLTQGRILAMAFYDDDTLVTGGRTGWINLWDARTGFRIGEPMNAHLSDVTGMTVSPETRSIISVSIANAIRWDLDRDNWPTGICELVGRDLTEIEWQRFLPDRLYHPTCTGDG